MSNAPEQGPEQSQEPDNKIEERAEAKKPLSPAAKRALAEAEERREKAEAARAETEKEVGGRGGADPARYGDWEIGGRAIDF